MNGFWQTGSNSYSQQEEYYSNIMARQNSLHWGPVKKAKRELRKIANMKKIMLSQQKQLLALEKIKDAETFAKMGSFDFMRDCLQHASEACPADEKVNAELKNARSRIPASCATIFCFPQNKTTAVATATAPAASAASCHAPPQLNH